MIYRFLLLFIVVSWSLTLQANPVVRVQFNDVFLDYVQQPRLSDLVAGVNSSANLYWPSASFYSLSSTEVHSLEQKKAKLLQRLTELHNYYAQHGDDDLAATTKKIVQELAPLQLAKKIVLPLDPDTVRIKSSLNPLIDAGQYLLVVAEKPATVAVFGAVENSSTLLLNASEAADYLSDLKLLEGASASFLYVVPANADPFIAKVGLWNRKFKAIPAGATLFVPLELRHLPSEFEDINQQVADLLVHKVVAP